MIVLKVEMNRWTTAYIEASAEDVALARRLCVGRGTFRVWREREQASSDGRDWADYLGPSRSDETLPVGVYRDALSAVRALREVMADVSMGGYRYGQITRGGVTVAMVRRGEIVAVGPAPKRAPKYPRVKEVVR